MSRWELILVHIYNIQGGILRFAGILNGISDEWNPRTDPHICANYGKTNYLEQKAKCKADLQRRLGLHEDPFTALIGFCGRLCFQKGVHMITNIIPWLMHDQGNGVNGRVKYSIEVRLSSNRPSIKNA